jgi:glyoxylase-like metal-dependent hydrolase (beta-lactamase superfamily II)
MAALDFEAHGEVTRVRLSHWRSRLVGYDVSAYLYRGALVDTGFPAAARDVARLARERRVGAAILTHHHEDHSGGVGALGAAGIGVAMAPATREALVGLTSVPLYRRITWGAPHPPGALPDVAVPGGLTLIATPGHSADHHAVWDAERGILFGGDLFLGVKVRIAHPEEDPRLLVRTLEAMAALEPAELFDAHRGRVPRAREALRAKAAWNAELIAAIDARIDEGWEDAAIRDELLGGESFSGRLSGGEYARISFVRAVRRTRR